MSKRTDDFAKELDLVTPRLIERAQGRCELRIPGACEADASGFAWKMERSHRLPRGQGGTNDIWNLNWTCAGCHRYIESHRADAYDHGWLVKTGVTSPAEVPCVLPDGTILVLDPSPPYASQMPGETK